MLDHIQSCLPEEACGLLAGTGTQVMKVYPVTNQYHSKVRFRMDDQELVKSLADLYKLGMQLIAIYHSHPQGPSHPSLTDQQEYAYPDSLSLIWFPLKAHWNCRAYKMNKHGYLEVPVRHGW